MPRGALAFNETNADTTPLTRHSMLLSSERDVQAPADLHLRPANRERPMGASHWGPAAARVPRGRASAGAEDLSSLVVGTLLHLKPSDSAAAVLAQAQPGGSRVMRDAPSPAAEANSVDSAPAPALAAAEPGRRARRYAPSTRLASELSAATAPPIRTPSAAEQRAEIAYGPRLGPAGVPRDSPSPSERAGEDGASSAAGCSAPASAARRAARPAITVRNSLRDHATLARASQRAGDTNAEARAHFARGVLHDAEGALDAAIAAYTLYLAACRRAGDVAGELVAYNHLGIDYQVRGDADSLHAAVACHTRHAEMADAAGQFVAHHNIGLCMAALGQDDVAAQHFEQALRLATERGDAAGEALAAGQLGAALGRLQDSTLARQLIERRMAIAESLGSTAERAVAYRQLGELCASLGDVEGARAHFERSIEWMRVADPRAACKALCDLGCLVADAKQHEAARGFFEAALALALRVEDPGLEARARCGVGIAIGNQVMLAHMAEVCHAMGSDKLDAYLVRAPDDQSADGSGADDDDDGGGE